MKEAKKKRRKRKKKKYENFRWKTVLQLHFAGVPLHLVNEIRLHGIRRDAGIMYILFSPVCFHLPVIEGHKLSWLNLYESMRPYVSIDCRYRVVEKFINRKKGRNRNRSPTFGSCSFFFSGRKNVPFGVERVKSPSHRWKFSARNLEK